MDRDSKLVWSAFVIAFMLFVPLMLIAYNLAVIAIILEELL